jgi:hypothetical protein
MIMSAMLSIAFNRHWGNNHPAYEQSVLRAAVGVVQQAQQDLAPTKLFVDKATAPEASRNRTVKEGVKTDREFTGDSTDSDRWIAAADLPPLSASANDARLWSALRDAVATTDPGSTRYALDCIQLRGAQGRIDATDGRHALAQTGSQFGFNDDVLVPAGPILGCRDLDIGEGVAVGRNGDWIGFGVGHWLVMLRINKNGRFPKLDDTIPNHEFARSQRDLSPSDAEFLAKVIQGLPCDDPQYARSRSI